eukprot:COSAG05_NODE_18941_length_300_cov_1.019900_1_plen_38_part_10
MAVRTITAVVGTRDPTRDPYSAVCRCVSVLCVLVFSVA